MAPGPATPAVELIAELEVSEIKKIAALLGVAGSALPRLTIGFAKHWRLPTRQTCPGLQLGHVPVGGGLHAESERQVRNFSIEHSP